MYQRFSTIEDVVELPLHYPNRRVSVQDEVTFELRLWIMHATHVLHHGNTIHLGHSEIGDYHSRVLAHEEVESPDPILTGDHFTRPRRAAITDEDGGFIMCDQVGDKLESATDDKEEEQPTTDEDQGSSLSTNNANRPAKFPLPKIVAPRNEETL